MNLYNYSENSPFNDNNIMGNSGKAGNIGMIPNFNEQFENNFNDNKNMMNYQFMNKEKNNDNSDDLFGQNLNQNFNNEE